MLDESLDDEIAAIFEALLPAEPLDNMSRIEYRAVWTAVDAQAARNATELGA